MKLSLLFTHLRTNVSKRSFNTKISCSVVETSSNEPPIVLAHGVLGNKNNFNSLSKHLVKLLGRSVVTYDARNHGSSDHSNEMSLENMSNDVLELLQRLGIYKCVLVGHSMGGRMAIHTALHNPDIIDKLVVVDSSPASSFSLSTSSDRESVLNYVKAMQRVTWNGNKSLSTARKDVDQQLLESVKDFSVRSFILTNVSELSPGNFGWRVNLDAICNHLVQSRQSEQTFKGLQYNKDTLFIGGGASPFIGYQDYPIIKQLFPKAVISHIPGGGHWVHSEKPSEFLQCIVSFIRPTAFPVFS
uniref:sn-1-specific diacylglycerol lipase ABHD11 n=1 Tax=Phallusia mammillata TaxID=59560 RepID=A0A6F9D4Z7_9ASCI|nr:alpha/beta hydrolase domain-containing protein 11 [Phallusia mammillata]